MIVAAWALLLYVCRIGRPRNQLPALLGQTWDSPTRAAADIALALSGWLLITAFELAWARWVATGVGASVAAMLPRTWLDGLAWGLVSVSVGFCEEVVFRGYLQTQLTAFTGRVGVAMVLQAALFGVAHAEQGAAAMVRIALYGLAFGALARWRRSLLPGIVCHVWTNLASGLLRL
jgi:membrane protease YdiL (CAAX protease family)